MYRNYEFELLEANTRIERALQDAEERRLLKQIEQEKSLQHLVKVKNAFVSIIVSLIRWF
ncbi:MAG: hypothetical protein D6706_12540 [Chloroflexi bacterium]|nr:MAG: hypothetical protein D6706_12540 [Chloroflexota bacterium]